MGGGGGESEVGGHLLSLQGSGEGFQPVFRKLRTFWWCPLVDGWKAWLTPLNLGAFVPSVVFMSFAAT